MKEGPRSLLAPFQRFTDAGTSERKAQKKEGPADNWSKRDILKEAEPTLVHLF